MPSRLTEAGGGTGDASLITCRQGWDSPTGVANLLNSCLKAEDKPPPTSELRWVGDQDGEDRMDGGCRRDPGQGTRTEIVLAG